MEELRHNQINEAKWNRWSKWFDGFSPVTIYLQRGQRAVISLMGPKEGSAFLDVGCGTGWALGQIATELNGKGHFYGIDMSAGMIDKAKQNFAGRDDFHFVRARAESIPLDDDLFDQIICTNSLHHYFHPAMALAEMRRLLKPSGRAYILDPTADSGIMRFWDRALRRIEPEHVKMYSTAEFKAMFEAAGLKYAGSRKIDNRAKVHIAEKPG
jgi:ubiquinone/menaquinone biosynthesis C-methylase UbiE